MSGVELFYPGTLLGEVSNYLRVACQVESVRQNKIDENKIM